MTAVIGRRLETGASPMAPGVDQRAANRHLRTVLIAKGNAVTYHEAPGGHDFATFRRSAVKGLRALLPGPAAGTDGPALSPSRDAPPGGPAGRGWR